MKFCVPMRWLDCWTPREADLAHLEHWYNSRNMCSSCSGNPDVRTKSGRLGRFLATHWNIMEHCVVGLINLGIRSHRNSCLGQRWRSRNTVLCFSFSSFSFVPCSGFEGEMGFFRGSMSDFSCDWVVFLQASKQQMGISIIDLPMERIQITLDVKLRSHPMWWWELRAHMDLEILMKGNVPTALTLSTLKKPRRTGS